MSLEEKVEALTSAIAALTVAINTQTAAAAPDLVAAQEAPAKEPAKTASKRKETKQEATTTNPATTTQGPAPVKEEIVKAELVITFEDLKKAVVAAADKDKPATAAALKALGVAKISELTEEQYAAAHEALIAVVDEKAEPPQEASFV